MSTELQAKSQYIKLSDINDSHIGKFITICGRVDNIRKNGSICFVILRDRCYTLQSVGFKKEIKDTFYSLLNLKNETYIHLSGSLTKLPSNIAQIESCYYKNFEFKIDGIQIISRPVEDLPLSLMDANCIYTEDNQQRSKVLLPTRLDHRYFELRTPLNNAIFHLKSQLIDAYRTFMLKQKHTEINSPKLIGTASETGSSVFNVKYFNKDAFLAQSPQLYKQMMINADFDGVFEIGPVFRAENALTHSHLCEFIGLDLEMRLSPPHYDFKEIIHKLWKCLSYMFSHLETESKTEIEYLQKYHNYEKINMPEDPIMLTFLEGVKLLETEGFTQNPLEDITTENERHLGEIIKKTRDSDIFALTNYPKSARPFYTEESPENPNYTNSYDIIMRGREICSGAQRVHDYDKLKSNILKTGSSSEPFEDYLNSFKYGIMPHGGGGLGLERILMLYFDLKNVRCCSLFPRDPQRLRP